MSINPPKQIDYLAARDSFIDVYAGALHAIFIKDEIFREAVDDPIQFGYYCMTEVLTDKVFDKVEKADVLKNWELLFDIRMGHRMNEDDLFTILTGSNPFRLVRTLWKQNLEIALGMARPAAADDDNNKEALTPWYFGIKPPWKRCFFDESLKTGARDDCWKRATAATDKAACNATLLLPPTTPEYDSPRYYHLPAWIESMLASSGEKSRLSATERKKKKMNCYCTFDVKGTH